MEDIMDGPLVTWDPDGVRAWADAAAGERAAEGRRGIDIARSVDAADDARDHVVSYNFV